MNYLYYPFDDGTGVQTLDDLISGIGNKVAPRGAVQSPAIGELYCDNGTTPGGLWAVTQADTIYVIGHSASGLKVLGDAKKGTIDQSAIVNRLERCGFSKTVPCTIVLYACYSSKAADNSEGLGAFVASALKTNKFACWQNVFGFRRPVGMKAKRGELYLEVNKGDWQPLSSVDSWAFEKVAPHV